MSKVAIELQQLSRALEKPKPDRLIVNYGVYNVTRTEGIELAEKAGGKFIRRLWDDTTKMNKVEIQTKMNPGRVEQLDKNIRDVTYAREEPENFG